MMIPLYLDSGGVSNKRDVVEGYHKDIVPCRLITTAAPDKDFLE